jgi:hypothetical protein
MKRIEITTDRDRKRYKHKAGGIEKRKDEMEHGEIK